MWVYTQHGFYSAVGFDPTVGGSYRWPVARVKPDKVMVRARFREDLDYLVSRVKADGDVMVTPVADYPYRVVMDREQWAKFLALEGMSIDYTNFKSRADKTLGHERHDQMMRVWSVMRAPLDAFYRPKHRKNGKKVAAK